MNEATSSRLISYKQLAAALSLGLMLRLFFIVHFRFFAGDSHFYEELARNWLTRGVYGIFIRGQLTPVGMRMPGYPAFLAAIYAVLGQSSRTVMVVQAFIDLGTCVLTALIAACLAPAPKRKLVATAALWLAALCPFTASYSAVVLTELLATFLTALAILLLLQVLCDPSLNLPPASLERRTLLSHAGRYLLCGFVVGIGTLVRPEAPLLLAAMAIALGVRWWRPVDWSKLALAGLWMAVGLLLPLTPWAARNVLTLGRVQYLASPWAQTDGDFIPLGYYGWIETWIVRSRDTYLATWKVGLEPVQIETLPKSAFDSPAEYARVNALLIRYNRNRQMTPLLDQEFALLAQERTARHPVRTYVFLPFARAWMLWFTPHIELLPYSGNLWPPADRWRANPIDFSVTLGFGILGVAYAGLGLLGAWRSRFHPGFILPMAYLVLRTALLTQRPTVEPRYMIVCIPLLLALGAVALGPAGSSKAQQ